MLIDGVMLLWFALTALSAAFVAIDIRGTPEQPVMKWAFILFSLYSGPLGAFLYALGCRHVENAEGPQPLRPFKPDAARHESPCILQTHWCHRGPCPRLDCAADIRLFCFLRLASLWPAERTPRSQTPNLALASAQADLSAVRPRRWPGPTLPEGRRAPHWTSSGLTLS
jgi:hypothetical protein